MRTLLLFLAAGLAVAEAADEVQQLPLFSVTGRTVPDAAEFTDVDLGRSAAGADGLTEAARHVAGLAVNDAGARGFGETTTLRGLGNTPFFSDASAPVYLDDIPLGAGYAIPAELFDFSRMTVFRGPQAAAQFGRAGDAGVIQFSSPAAGASAAGTVSGSAGSAGMLAFAASAQTARRADFDAAVYLGTSRRDGFITNTRLRETVDTRESVSGRVQLHYRPDPGLEITVHVLAQRARDGADALVPLGGPLYTVSRAKEGETDTDFAAVAVGVSKRLGDATLRATTSYTDWKLAPYANELMLYGAPLDSELSQSQRAFNEEIRYAGRWLTAGFFYARTEAAGAADRTFGGFPYEQSGFTLDSDTAALFGQTGFRPAADWRVTAGARLETTGKVFSRDSWVPVDPRLDLSGRWNAFLPSLALTRQIGAATEAVVTVARGFKPGGYSAYADRADLAGYGAQATWGAEAALTTADAQAGWSVTTRAYAYRVAGYQIERSFAVPGAASSEYMVVNARRARVLGLEFESAWRIAPDVAVRLVAGLTDATLQDFTDPFTGIRYSGNRAPYAPSGNAAVRIDYAPARGCFAGAGLTWTGRTYYDEQETAGFAQAAYALVEARAGYGFGRGRIQLFGRNLTGTTYYSGITPGVGHGTPGAPLQWGVELTGQW